MAAVRVTPDRAEVPDGFPSSVQWDIGSVRALEREVTHLRQGLASSRHIGMAIGLLAHRFGCTTDQAWALLDKLSQDCNAKVRDIARVLVEGFDGQGRADDAELMTLVASHLPPTG